MVLDLPALIRFVTVYSSSNEEIDVIEKGLAPCAELEDEDKFEHLLLINIIFL